MAASSIPSLRPRLSVVPGSSATTTTTVKTVTPPPPPPPPHILVIDDDEMVRKALVRVLRRRYAITEQRDAESALLLLTSGVKFDAILCDLNLNGMSGRELVLELEFVAPDQAARVIILSGSAKSAMDDEFLEAISTRFLEKPASLAEIEAALASLITVEAAPRAA